MRAHYPKLRNIVLTIYLPLNVFIANKESNLYVLFIITVAGGVPCGGPKTSPRTLSIVQIIFYLGPLRSVKIFGVS